MSDEASFYYPGHPVHGRLQMNKYHWRVVAEAIAESLRPRLKERKGQWKLRQYPVVYRELEKHTPLTVAPDVKHHEGGHISVTFPDVGKLAKIMNVTSNRKKSMMLSGPVQYRVTFHDPSTQARVHDFSVIIMLSPLQWQMPTREKGSPGVTFLQDPEMEAFAHAYVQQHYSHERGEVDVPVDYPLQLLYGSFQLSYRLTETRYQMTLFVERALRPMNRVMERPNPNKDKFTCPGVPRAVASEFLGQICRAQSELSTLGVDVYDRNFANSTLTWDESRPNVAQLKDMIRRDNAGLYWYKGVYYDLSETKPPTISDFDDFAHALNRHVVFIGLSQVEVRYGKKVYRSLSMTRACRGHYTVSSYVRDTYRSIMQSDAPIFVPRPDFDVAVAKVVRTPVIPDYVILNSMKPDDLDRVVAHVRHLLSRTKWNDRESKFVATVGKQLFNRGVHLDVVEEIMEKTVINLRQQITELLSFARVNDQMHSPKRNALLTNIHTVDRLMYTGQRDQTRLAYYALMTKHYVSVEDVEYVLAVLGINDERQRNTWLAAMFIELFPKLLTEENALAWLQRLTTCEARINAVYIACLRTYYQTSAPLVQNLLLLVVREALLPDFGCASALEFVVAMAQLVQQEYKALRDGSDHPCVVTNGEPRMLALDIFTCVMSAAFTWSGETNYEKCKAMIDEAVAFFPRVVILETDPLLAYTAFFDEWHKQSSSLEKQPMLPTGLLRDPRSSFDFLNTTRNTLISSVKLTQSSVLRRKRALE